MMEIKVILDPPSLRIHWHTTCAMSGYIKAGRIQSCVMCSAFSVPSTTIYKTPKHHRH